MMVVRVKVRKVERMVVRSKLHSALLLSCGLCGEDE